MDSALHTFIPKMEAADCFETLVSTDKITRYHNSKVFNINTE
jgi:hypothetical protein